MEDPCKRRGIRKDRVPQERSRVVSPAGMVRLNDEALVAVTEMVLPYILREQPDHPVCLRSGVYAATGIRGLRRVKVLCAELQPGSGCRVKKREIYVTAVCPGPVETEFSGSLSMEESLHLSRNLTDGRSEKSGEKALLDSMKGQTDLGIWSVDEGILCSLPDRSA